MMSYIIIIDKPVPIKFEVKVYNTWSFFCLKIKHIAITIYRVTHNKKAQDTSSTSALLKLAIRYYSTRKLWLFYYIYITW